MADIHLSVRIAGQDASNLVARVEVEESDLRADLATLTFHDRSLALPDILHEGLPVEIDLGSRSAHARLFRGTVTSVRCSFARLGAARVVVEAVDGLAGLALKPRTKRWWNTTLSTVVREVALAGGMAPGRIAPGADPVFDEDRPLQQVEETDLALLHRLADAYDCKVSVDHSGPRDLLDFVATRTLLADPPIAQQLVHNLNVLDLETAFDAFATDPKERLVTTDPQTGDRVETEQTSVTGADTGWVPDPTRLVALGKGSEWAAAILLAGAPVRARLTESWRTRERLAGAASRTPSDRSSVLGDRARRFGQTATGRAAGNVLFQPRRRVRLSGFGGRWSGDWYLARVRHEVDVMARSYTTAFMARR
ncbi:phage late control D family protein [Streptomyces fulvoviolaceus]|uniref:phage late control D family protein n=1 Tax=Streptomyces fulvoviolaceus TaxID=285535 RepID=UPI0021C168CF|nr:phage late control D family protein [Streptomyces fulvoviolaceus]MCT9078068.1 phage late control D family protein [Streptomyces fulvoviolaceus]